MITEVELGGLQLINAPGDWKLPNSIPIQLESLLKDRGKGHLRPTKINVKQIAVAVAVVLCIGIVDYRVTLVTDLWVIGVTSVDNFPIRPWALFWDVG